MTVSPKKYTSNFTTSTANRGVEAKEVEIANIHLDTSVQPSSQQSNRSQPSMDFSRTTSSPPSRDDSASYIQVVVQKQRRRRDSTGALRVPRLPRPSSPTPSLPLCQHKSPVPQIKPARAQFQSRSAAGNCLETRNINGNSSSKQNGCIACKAWPESLLACPAFAALHQSCGVLPEKIAERKEDRVARPRGTSAPPKNNISLWRQMRNLAKGNVALKDGPERLDVYRFETGLATLNARGSAPTRLERALRRSARPASALVAEALAAPRLLMALPVALLLMALRTVLTPARDLSVGLVQTVSDYALKPALALAFNALLQPALSCAMQTSRALRAAVRPLAMALADAVEPLARLLASVRLVHVERHCTCPHPV